MKTITFLIHRFIERFIQGRFTSPATYPPIYPTIHPTIHATKPWRSWKPWSFLKPLHRWKLPPALKFRRTVHSSWSVVGLFAILFATGLTNSQAQDTWTQKADFEGISRGGSAGFSIGDKGYVGTGHSDDTFESYTDFWEYDPATDAWTQRADFGGTGRAYAVGFSIGNKGYIGTGAYFSEYFDLFRDFWEYDPTTNSWTKKASFEGTSRYHSVGFSINGKGYIGTGADYSVFSTEVTKDFWEYDPSTDAWTEKASFGGSARYGAVGFCIGSKGYIGTGGQYGHTRDFWEYDPGTDTWTQKADFGGTARKRATGFSIGNKGYIGTGYDDFNKADFWEYEPTTNTWTQKADFGGTARGFATGFSISSNGYIEGGSDGSNRTDFWEYNPNTLSCSVPANLSVTKITSSSAKLKWDTVAGAQKYKVRYKITGSSAWTTITNISSASKKISGLAPNTSYTCEVKSVCSSNPIVSSDWSSKQTFTTSSERIGDESLQPVSFSIYPNPVEDHATVQFTLRHSSHVYIKVYDASGKEVETLVDAQLQQGEHSLQLNISHFPKGVYMLRMISDTGIQNQKLIVQ